MVFICSKDFERSLGDTAKVIEIARNLKAKKISILDVGLEDQFSVTGELKGRVIRIVVPKNIVLANCSQNYAYHMAVTLALDENHVVVSDPATVQLMALG